MRLPPEMERAYQERKALEEAYAEAQRREREAMLSTGNRHQRRAAIKRGRALERGEG